MAELARALTDLATTGEDVVVLMRALKVVLALHERRAAQFAATVHGRDCRDVHMEIDEIERLLPVATDLGLTAASMMAEARANAVPVIAEMTARAISADSAELLGACGHTLAIFESTRLSIDYMIAQTTALARGPGDEQVERADVAHASAAVDELLIRLRHRAPPDLPGSR